MRQIIFSNGDILEVSDRSNHLCVIFEDVAQEDIMNFITMDASLWESFTIRRTTERDTKDFPYENHTLDHIELKGTCNVLFFLRELTEGELAKQALDILLGVEE